MSWSEDNLHRWLARRGRPECLSGSTGHDAAVLRPQTGRDVLCVDQVVEGVHAEVGTPLRALGRKAAARALSDLAATAAKPRCLLLTLRAPTEAQEVHLREAITAVDKEGRKHGAPLVGGDLSCAPGPLSLGVTALGYLDSRRRPPGRDRARPGQTILVTGPLGGSRLGRHLRPVPRLKVGRWLHARGATAMMDVSDGLAWDLHRLARASGVAIHLDRVPIHPDARRAGRASGRTALDHALHDGEDYELLASVPGRSAASLLAAGQRSGHGLWDLGRVEAGSGLWIAVDGNPRPWSPDEGGWRHGS